MAKKKQQEVRERGRLYRAQRREESIVRLQKDFRAAAIDARLDRTKLTTEDIVNSDGGKLLAKAEAPAQFQRLLDSFRNADPKTRRLATRTLDVWKRIDSGLFMDILEQCFFDGQGNLKSPDLGPLFQKFHESLMEEMRRMNRMGLGTIPWEKAAALLGEKRTRDGEPN